MMTPELVVVSPVKVQEVPVRPPWPTTAVKSWKRPLDPAAPPCRVHPVGAAEEPLVALSSMKARSMSPSDVPAGWDTVTEVVPVPNDPAARTDALTLARRLHRYLQRS